MESSAQQNNSEVTLGEREMSVVDIPAYPINRTSTIHEVKSGQPETTTNAGHPHPEQSADVADLEKAQPEKKKLPSILSPELKKDRMHLLKSLLRIEALLVVIILGILSIYWAGLASIEPNVRVLTVAIVDFDGQEVGHAFTAAGIPLFN
jgi:hypothetical protein